MKVVRRVPPLIHLLVACSILSGAGCGGDKERKKERFLAGGEEYFQQGQYPQALTQFKNVIQLDPTSAIGYYRLGLTYAKLGRAADTFVAFRKSVEADPAFPSAQIELGNLYLLSNRPFEAKQCARNALATDPGHWKAWILLANASIMLKQFPEAGSALEGAIKVAPHEILPGLLMAKLHEISGNIAEAERVYLNLARRFPDSLRVEEEILNFYGTTGQKDKLLKRASENLEQTPIDPVRMEILANVCLETGLARTAVLALEKALFADPQNGPLHMQLGSLYLREGERDRARAELEKAVALSEKNLVARITLADLLLSESSLEEAEPLVNQLIEQKPDDPRVVSLQGRVHHLKRDYNAAIEAFQEAIGKDPSAARPHYFLGKSRAAKGQVDLAKKDFLKASELDPGLVPAKTALAELYIAQREGKFAEPILQELIDQKGEDPKLLWLLAETLKLQGRLEGAERAIERFIAATRENGRGYYELGRLLQAQGKPDQALFQFQKAVALDPNAVNASAMVVDILMKRKEKEQARAWLEENLPRVENKALLYNLLGKIYLSENELERAKEYFQSSIIADPDMLDSYVNLGSVYTGEHARDNALLLYESLLERNPESPSANMLIGMMYETMGRRRKAAEYYVKALELKPNFGPAANNLAWYYSEEGNDLGRALLLAEKARERLPENPFVADTCGWIYQKKGLHDKARALLEESRAALPDHPTVHYHLGVTYHSLGETEKARTSLQEALRLNPGFSEAEEAERLLDEIVAGTG